MLESSGIIPDDFLQNVEQRYDSQKRNLSEKQKQILGSELSGYLFLSAYQTASLLQSGMVTFNDPISEYSSKVLDKLLENNKELRKKIRVYTIKSTQVNAFITGDGIIFISVGLITQLNNEAQLAFVLAHELIHYIKNHHIHEFLKKQDFIDNFSKSKSNELKLKSIFTYSKENELEADSEAFSRFYLNSGYSVAEIESLLDILLYSYLPIDEIEFDLSFFEGGDYIFPKEYTLTDYNEITAVENYDDTKLTHPNILKRRSALKLLLSGYKENKGAKFIVSEDDFNLVKKISRFELSLLYRLNNDFERAIYNSYVMLQEYPDNKFLETNIAECLYALSFYKNRGEFSRVHVNPKKIEGYSQQVNYFFSEMKKNEMNLLSLRYSWLLVNKFPNDPYLKRLSDSVIKENVIYLKENLNDFKAETFVKLDSAEYAQLNKTEKIKYNKKLESEDNIKYYYNVLTGLKNTDEIYKKYYNYLRIKEKEKNIERLTDKKRKIPDLENLFLFSVYMEIKPDNQSEEEMISYYKKRDILKNALKKSARKLNISAEEFNINNISKEDVKKFNEYALLSLSLYEMTMGINGILNGTEKYLNDEIITDKNKYSAYTGITYSSDKPYYFLIVYDIKEGNVIYAYEKRVKKIKKDYMTSVIYSALYYINNEK